MGERRAMCEWWGNQNMMYCGRADVGGRARASNPGTAMLKIDHTGQRVVLMVCTWVRNTWRVLLLAVVMVDGGCRISQKVDSGV